MKGSQKSMKIEVIIKDENSSKQRGNLLEKQKSRNQNLIFLNIGKKAIDGTKISTN